jgi:SAM-dependent methyltransferase
MQDDSAMTELSPTHGPIGEPSPWIARFASLVPVGGRVLDVACGGGRHTRLFLDLGHPVTAVDIDISGLEALAGRPGLRMVAVDLEDGKPWPFIGETFAAVVVANYLYRSLLSRMVEAVEPGGLLLYDTFAVGNEQFGRPRNPDFLLQPGELLAVAATQLRVLAYEDLIVDDPQPAAMQRIAARRES